jgi:UDP-N-acetylmuramoyl-L-alanyl-D-glutamate--2,6-diaminopimelate ligase
MQLVDLLAHLDVRSVRGATERTITRVTDRDEAVTGTDTCFVAVRGARVDGHDRIPAHAACAVVEREVDVATDTTVVQVGDTRAALAALAAAIHGHPGASVPVVGITGTNGKTSTTFLLASIARAAGLVPGIIGTTGHFIGDTRLPTGHTTPDAPTTQALLARMRDAGAGLVGMEVSSIGLAARRADSLPFRAAVFTNLTRDHLDYHGTMEAYALAKARLFSDGLAEGGTAILHGADPACGQMTEAVRPGSTIWTYAVGSEAHLRADLADLSWRGTRARVTTPHGIGALALRVLGRHNVQNALGALGAALAVGIDLDVACAGLSACTGIPGRLQAVPNDRGFAVLVDYAHTDDALTRVLAELRLLGPRRILTVFGCGGDRDRGKRPLMGAAAAAGSDFVVVTSDNPRSEDPASIVADIVPGIGSAPYAVVLDRREAITYAIRLAGPGDIVLLAGKGHEATQIIGADVFPFDDVQVASEVLA